MLHVCPSISIPGRALLQRCRPLRPAPASLRAAASSGRSRSTRPRTSSSSTRPRTWRFTVSAPSCCRSCTSPYRHGHPPSCCGAVQSVCALGRICERPARRRPPIRHRAADRIGRRRRHGRALATSTVHGSHAALRVRLCCRRRGRRGAAAVAAADIHPHAGVIADPHLPVPVVRKRIARLPAVRPASLPRHIPAEAPADEKPFRRLDRHRHRRARQLLRLDVSGATLPLVPPAAPPSSSPCCRTAPGRSIRPSPAPGCARETRRRRPTVRARRHVESVRAPAELIPRIAGQLRRARQFLAPDEIDRTIRTSRASHGMAGEQGTGARGGAHRLCGVMSSAGARTDSMCRRAAFRWGAGVGFPRAARCG